MPAKTKVEHAESAGGREAKPRRRVRSEIVSHAIQIEHWDFDYLFGIDDHNTGGKLPYWESRRIEMRGRIIRPLLKASAATVGLYASDGLIASVLRSYPFAEGRLVR
jgi:hypothetical protein